MCTTRVFSTREVQPPFKPALKYLQEQMVLRLWIPSIGQRTNLSTRDGNFGLKRLDSLLMPWREIQRKPRFLTSIIGSMEREWDTLSHGKTARPSSASAQHKILSQLNSSSSMNFAAYDHRQNKGKSNKSKHTSGKNVKQNNSGAQVSSNHNQPSRKPPGMEGKCMRCGKPEHQPGQKCAAKNAKCN